MLEHVGNAAGMWLNVYQMSLQDAILLLLGRFLAEAGLGSRV